MDFAQFNAYHTPALEREEAKHCLILSLMARRRSRSRPTQTQKWSLGEPAPLRGSTQGRGSSWRLTRRPMPPIDQEWPESPRRTV